jgi:hypothetical protein
MELLHLVGNWQQQAIKIAPPENAELIPARGGLPGPAFFPEGLGLQNAAYSNENWPTVMAIGHNFGCEKYRQGIDVEGREDDKATWRGLCKLLTDAGGTIEMCYMTNWFIGLQPGSKQLGNFLLRPESRYETECRNLLLQQIKGLEPETILLLGLNVVARAHEIMPGLVPWAGARNWKSVDNSLKGPVYDVEVPGAGIKVNVVALLHPSFSAPNQRFRRGIFSIPKPEVEMVRHAFARCDIQRYH